MFFGKMVNPNFINQVFGLSTLEGVDSATLSLPHLESDLSMRINNMVAHLRRDQFNFQQVSVSREGESRSVDFLNLLVEDRINAQSLSYADFLVHIHRGSQAAGTHQAAH